MSEPYRSEIDGNMSIRSDKDGKFFVLMQDGSWEEIEKTKNHEQDHPVTSHPE